ncbi:MAG TPA: DMT family transporter [Ferruginibacter sp.]|nr:DMT family transporter [Ferruginibacter sp.]HNA00192.1 DMT family transporter [Ferruginibacter sp.]HNN70907.1 DMT family transporter [Ferruginibacter sp.]HNO98473.1 DMT family transporter [Ferruginibacter sp.]
MNKRTTAHLALLFTNLFFAINLSAVKHLTNAQLAGPFGINVVRVGVSTILFWCLFFLKPANISIAREDRLRLILCAVTGIAVNQLLFLKGLSLTYSIHASLLMLTTPILIVFIAAWLLKEKAGPRKIAGLLLGIAGALVLILAKDNSGNGNNVLFGDILIIINAISYTIYFILVKPLMLKYNPVVLIRWIFTIGLILVLPFGWAEFTAIRWEHFQPVDMLSISLVTLTGTFLAYLFNIYGIKVLGSSVAGFYIYTQPVFAALIAMLFLREELTLYKLIAALMIFTGVYLANRQSVKSS